MSTRLSSTILAILLLCAGVTSCTDSQTPTPIPPVFQGSNPYSPRTGDASMQRGELKIVSSSLIVASLPGQAVLKFDYFLPTPCHQLRVEIGPAGADHRINLTAYSLIEPNRVCTLMQLATPQHASLALAGYPAGAYTLWLNSAAVGDWTVP